MLGVTAWCLCLVKKNSAFSLSAFCSFLPMHNSYAEIGLLIRLDDTVKEKSRILFGLGFFFLRLHQPFLRMQRLAYFRSADVVG